ncbi:MAG: signal peptidase II [Pseudomonadota bacterium]
MISRTGAIALAIAIFVADQASKLWVLYGLDLSQGPVRIAPFAEIVLVWNRGISYGLFQQEGVGRWVLAGLTAAASVALAIWLWRTQRPILRLALALLVGGAVGNLVDRVVYGAVVDFMHLFAAGYSWYVFNVADTAIVLGVIALLWDSAFGKEPVDAR